VLEGFFNCFRDVSLLPFFVSSPVDALRPSACRQSRAASCDAFIVCGPREERSSRACHATSALLFQSQAAPLSWMWVRHGRGALPMGTHGCVQGSRHRTASHWQAIRRSYESKLDGRATEAARWTISRHAPPHGMAGLGRSLKILGVLAQSSRRPAAKWNAKDLGR